MKMILQKNRIKRGLGINKYILVLVCIIFCSNSFSQKELAGTYTYKYVNGTVSYFESISLFEDGRFSYTMKGIMGIHLAINGNWQKREHFLILDSSPQRDKIIVQESYIKKTKGLVFNAVDKNMFHFSYDLYAIQENGDTLILKGQWGKINLKEVIKTFWLINSMGLKSPEYRIKSKTYNTIDVIFETQRVLDNEHWIMIDDKTIQPIGLNGEIQNYNLIKE